MKETIALIAKRFNENHIHWGLGGSLVLKHHGIVNKSNDIDLLIGIEDVEKAMDILDELGKRIDIEVKTEYGTKVFVRYEVNGCEIDVMSRFIIKHELGSYEFIFDDQSVTSIEEYNGTSILYTSVEDWFVAYMLMKGRAAKVRVIQDYLQANGVKYPKLLIRAMTQELPERIIEEIEAVMS